MSFANPALQACPIRRILFTDSDLDSAGVSMEFRLTYAGPLRGIGNKPRPEHIHDLRRVFHHQLKHLWATEPFLKTAYHSHPFTGRVTPERRLHDYLASQFPRFGFNFLPLVTKDLRLLCGLDILLLRPEPPGALIQSGDLDNRINTIFDALSMPSQKEQVNHAQPQPGEDPFYCLLADDRLISRVSVETDMMHQAVSVPMDKFDVRIVIKATLKPFDMGWDNLNFS